MLEILDKKGLTTGSESTIPEEAETLTKSDGKKKNNQRKKKRKGRRKRKKKMIN